MERLRRKISAGTKLLVEGETGRAAFLVEDGELEALIGDAEDRIGLIRAGELVGEMSLISDRKVSATVRAVTDCRLIEIPRAAFEKRVKEADPLLRVIIRDLVHRAHDMIEHVPKPDQGDKRAASELVNTAIKQLRAEVMNAVLMEGALQHALESDQITVYLQPIVQASDGSLAGVEALVRWPYQGGLRLPAEFIGLAEQTGLIRPLGRKVLVEAAKALTKLKAHAGSAPGALFVAVNVSPRQFDDPELAGAVEAVIREHGLVDGELKLEVTESAVMDDPAQSVARLKAFRELGVHLNVDDFGTGYSSLVYLAQLPLSGLKIDKYFVQDMFRQPQSMALVRAIVSLSKDLGLKTVAEGVETVAQRDALRALGVDLIQGYLYAKVLSFDEMIAWHDAFGHIGDAH